MLASFFLEERRQKTNHVHCWKMRLRPGWRARDEVGAEPRDDGGFARGDEHPPQPLGLGALRLNSLDSGRCN